MTPRSRTHALTIGLTVALAAALAPPSASAADRPDVATVVTRGLTHTASFPDDICGPRASSVTFTATISQWQLVLRSDGTYQYRDMARVSYQVDFVDPALSDYSGRLTEVNHYIFTPGNTFIATNTYSDIGGDLKIWERLNFKEVDGTVVVDRYIHKATGCP